jgi:tetratricopeptide (TPR) repeat protein
MLTCDLRFKPTLTLLAALAAGSLPGSSAARAAERWNVDAAAQVHSNPAQACPSPDDLDATLGQASSLMQQSRYQDAAGLLQPLSSKNCDPRVSLLLAAALEGQGSDGQDNGGQGSESQNSAGQNSELRAITVLEHAHSVWPTNNSIAASLARAYLARGEKDRAAQALAHFHATAETPEQEMEMAVVVYLAAERLVPARKVAEEDYKSYPSLHSLLLAANTLQLEGRYPDVNRLLSGKRALYAESPEFLVTLAESESDASIFPAARADLQRAISLNPKMYQAHYLLGNVLAKTGNADGAIAEYRLAIGLAPEQPRTYFQLALALRTKQDDAGEQRALEQALGADSTYAPAHCELGRMLLESHHPADAVSHLLSAIQSNPRSEKAYFLLARAYAALGERTKSDEMVKRLQAVREENRPGPNNNGGSGNGSSGPGDEATNR